MLNKNFILHLTLIEDIGPAIIQKILERSDVQISDLYLFSISDWMHVFGLSEKTASKIVAGLSDQKMLEQELQLIEKNNIQWITIADESYPSLLKEIHLPPAVLYFQGTSFEEVSKCLAIVGARKANEYGQRVINQIVPDLVSAGYTIVSGGALGIDTMAHEAALACGGKTIAVLGSGLLRPYPSQNKSLFKKIIDQNGIMVSSYPLSTEPLPGNFPARNRIVTGLSRGCLVVQAAEKSGALISAHCALEQGRDVFAVPGLFDDELSAGCHEIIKQGAKLTVSAADILSEFGDRVVLREQAALQQQLLFSSVNSDPSIHPTTPRLRRTLRANGEESPKLSTTQLEFSPIILSPSKDERSKYSSIQQKIIVTCKQPISCDDIIAATQLSSEIVQAELFNLQLEGIIEQDFMGMWIINDSNILMQE